MAAAGFEEGLNTSTPLSTRKVGPERFCLAIHSYSDSILPPEGAAGKRGQETLGSENFYQIKTLDQSEVLM
jgi:hypothetical protein